MDTAEQPNPKRSTAAPTTIDDLPIDPSRTSSSTAPNPTLSANSGCPSTTSPTTAIDCNAEKIELGFYIHDVEDDDELYPFHFADLWNRSVRCLSLSDCKIVLPGNCSIRFDSIRVLSLTLVAITDIESLSSLILMCGRLEEFSLDFGITDESRKFKISSNSLKLMHSKFESDGFSKVLALLSKKNARSARFVRNQSRLNCILCFGADYACEL